MSVDLGVDPALARARATTSLVELLGDVLNALDLGLRSTRNKFRDAALLLTGAATGQVPVLDAGGKLPAGVVPDNLPFSRVTSGKFTSAQIPSHFANRIGAGPLPAGRFGGLPALKLQSGTVARARLPVGYSLLSRPTAAAVGGQGVQDSSGATVGTRAGFVETRRVVNALPAQVPAGHFRAAFGDYRPGIQGRVEGSTLYVQVVIACTLPKSAGWIDGDAGGGVCLGGICSAERGPPARPGDGDGEGGDGPPVPPSGG